MTSAEIADRLKWLAVELEIGRPNWTEVMRAGVELIRQAYPLAEQQLADRFGKSCARCGQAL